MTVVGLSAPGGVETLKSGRQLQSEVDKTWLAGENAASYRHTAASRLDEGGRHPEIILNLGSVLADLVWTLH